LLLPTYGYPLKANRRKVLLWSRRPWENVETIGSPLLPPGRFVAGTTKTPGGKVRFIGVCIPWRDAHVRSGQKNRKVWEDHLAYLENFPLVLTADRSVPIAIIGDFNQRIPRDRQPKNVFSALTDVLSDLQVVTAGHMPEAPHSSIDHLAISNVLEPTKIESLNNYDANGKQMSDHYGLKIMLRRL
jgi:endonuclease/exonuclease/phosphatase family metal-dependent hydrolase